MTPLHLTVMLILALLWFVLFWIIGGILFAVVGLVRFLRLNKNRFSCLFTFFSGVTAVGASWMGLLAAEATPARVCIARGAVAKAERLTTILPNLFRCSYEELLSAAGLWFLFLLAIGIILMFISRTPEKPRDIHGNH